MSWTGDKMEILSMRDPVREGGRERPLASDVAAPDLTLFTARIGVVLNSWQSGGSAPLVEGSARHVPPVIEEVDFLAASLKR